MLIKEKKSGSVIELTQEEWLELGLPIGDLNTGKSQGELVKFSPWEIAKAYKAIATSDGPNKTLVFHGRRTLQNVYQSGYEIEGRVSVGGKRYRGFSSSQLCEVDGRLVDLATIHVCDGGGEEV